jgi:hypothetical protein
MTSAMLPFRVGSLIAITFGFGTFARGQGVTAPQGRAGRPDAVQRELQRQFEMRMIEKALEEGRTRQVQRYAPLVLEQIKTDFLRIQIVDRKLAQAALAADTLDLAFVARSAAELKMRSRRLKKNLALPEPATVDRARIAVEAKPASLRSSLSVLSNLIEEFVSNPMFEQLKLVDAQLSAKAWRDLEAVIELSTEIKRSSESLKRPAKSP